MKLVKLSEGLYKVKPDLTESSERALEKALQQLIAEGKTPTVVRSCGIVGQNFLVVAK